MKTLTVIKPNGNHSNRLLQNLHFEAFCMEHNIAYHNPTFSDMATFYVKPCNARNGLFFRFLQINLIGKIFQHSRVAKRIFSVVWLVSKLGFLKLVRFDKEIKEEKCSEILLNAFKKNDTVYAAGWWFRQPKLIEKHKNEQRQRYLLKSDFYKENGFVQKISKLRAQNYTLIGVHCRRGDYQKWKGGAYFFNDETYKKAMKNLSKSLPEQKKEKIIFILFSNETLDFQQNDNLFISKEEWFIDHHIMSLCHYLIGPPSTFTLWASYIGDGQLFYIVDKDGKLEEQKQI